MALALGFQYTLTIIKAGLRRDVPTPFRSHSPYGLGSKTEAARSILWESLDSSAGEISLDNAEARAMGLPESSPFFWDESRSIYLVNAHHSMHCLVGLSNPRFENISMSNGMTNSANCAAGSPSRSTTARSSTPTRTWFTAWTTSCRISCVKPTIRLCRSWDALDAWAHKQTACFAYVNETQGVGAVIDRFRYCPKNSLLLEPMRKYFGYAESWWKPAPNDIDTIPKYWEAFEDRQIGY